MRMSSEGVKPGVPVTLGDLATMVGVSRATASKALNGRRDVSVGTRARVLAAAKEVGYERSASGASASYPVIALVADDFIGSYALDILYGAATSALMSGVALVTLYTPKEAPPGVRVPLTDEWLDMVKAQDWLGIIVVTTRLSTRQLNKVSAIDLPLVVIDPANALPPHVASIGATNWNGGVEATQHLLDLGHKRIAFIRGTTGSVPSAERLQGYLSALGMRGMAPDARWIIGDEFSHAAGRRAAHALLDLPPTKRPTAIFASADSLALGVYEAAHARGFSIPRDLSVVGFDDSMIAEITTPGLTTIRQPLGDMGAAAVRHLVDLSKGRTTTSGPMRLATQLVIRASTAPPPAL